jgi:hypothetical protein
VSGVHLPPGMLLHIACDEQHSDSSLGPGTPKSRGQLQLQAMQPQLSDV